MLDPDCAMAYWGMAMANCENEPRGKSSSSKRCRAEIVGQPGEVLWIDGYAAFLNADPKAAHKDRWRNYIRSVEAIVQENPNDLEARRAFLIVAIWKASSHDVPIGSHEAVEALIREILVVEPMHAGAHHYRIHLWDHEKPARAIPSAARAVSRPRRSRTCGTCRGIFFSTCTAMPTRPGSRKPHRGSIMPT